LKRFGVIIIICLVAVGSLLYFLIWREQPQRHNSLRLSGRIGIKVTDLAFMVPGKIAAIKFQEGQEIKAGEMVAELETQDFQQDIEVAEGKIEVIDASPRPEKLRNAELRQARAMLQLARARFNHATLTSPVNGIVLARAAEPGEVAAVGATILSVGDLDNVWFEGYIPAPFLAKVKYGQQADITIDYYLGKKFPGLVSFISAKAEFTPKTVETYKERITLVYRTKINLTNRDLELKQGMPAEAVIYLDSQRP
jgi:multidrug resistance efflux pump